MRRRLTMKRRPQSFGSYKVKGLLGRGGMGVVYRAESPAGEAVAIKVIGEQYARDDHLLQRFMREF
jgi:serine/threonine protein kinase